MVEPDRPKMTRWRMRIACRITKARIQTHTQNMQFLLLSHSNNDNANAPQCYVCTYIAYLV